MWERDAKVVFQLSMTQSFSDSSRQTPLGWGWGGGLCALHQQVDLNVATGAPPHRLGVPGRECARTKPISGGRGASANAGGVGIRLGTAPPSKGPR